MTDGVFRTDDMTLVAVLVMHRHSYTLETVQGLGARKRANWVFKHTGELQKLVEQYNATTLKVEPQMFVRNLAKVRGEMYAEIPERRERTARSA